LEIADLNGDGGLDLISSQRESITVDFTNPSLTGHYIAGAGEFSELTQLADGTWERVYKDGTIVVFDANGRQTATVDTYGNSISYVYDAEGRVASKTDQVGNSTVFEYDDEGYLASITYPDGRVTEFGYDNSYQLTEITDPSSATISFDYDENGRLVSTTNANGNTSGYEYDSNGNLSGATLPNGSSIATQLSSSLGLIDGLGNTAMNPLGFVAPEDRVTTVTDRKGELTEIEVNQWGSVIRVTDPLGRTTLSERDDQNRVVRVEQQFSETDTRVTAITYDWQNNVASVTEAVDTDSARTTSYIYEGNFNKVIKKTDPEGYATSYEYDAFGQATLVTDPESGTMSYTYEDDGQLASRTDENGNATAFTYDADGNLLTTTFADGSVTATTYDDQGNTTVIAEAQGTDVERQVHRTYDALNRVLTVEVTGADGAQIDGTTQYTYDAAGNLSSVTDETGLLTTMTYDELEQLVSVADPAEGLIRRVYNDASEVIGHINGDGETHTYAYDTVGRLTETTDPQGFVKTFAYDGRDNISTVVDGRGGETSFVYDALDRMVTRTNPIGLAMERAYDTRGMLTTLVREDGGIETAQYDGLGRRTSVATLDNTLTYAYDPVGNLVEAQDKDSRVTFAYDARNRLVTTTTDGTASLQPDVTLTYTYDALDRRMTMADSLGGTTTYSYDPEDRLADLTAPWGTVYSFGYDGEGRRTSLASTSGRQTTYGYTNGLLSALTHIQSGTTLTDLAYEYGPDGQLTAILDNLSPDTSRFISYDALNRLIQVDEGASVADGGVPIPVEDYAYDEEGNRTASHLSTLYNSNAHNQLEEDSDHTYAYDARGNRISRTSKASGAIETYAYDSQNRLVGYANDTLSARYAYDALDRRIAKIIDAPDVPITLAKPFALSATNTGAVDIENITLTGDFTFEGWVRFDSGSTIDNTDAFVRNGAGQGTQSLNFYDRRLRLYMPSTGAPLDKIIAATPVVAGDWTHYALTRDGAGALKLYINGVLDVTAAVPFTRSLNVGQLGQISNTQFDDIRIWSVARSAADIAADLSSFIDPATAGLERLYTFDTNPGQVIDATGNSAPAALGTDVILVPSTAPTQGIPYAPTTPGASAEVTAYVYDPWNPRSTVANDVALEFKDGALDSRWLVTDQVDEPIAFERYSGTDAAGSGAVHDVFSDRLGSPISIIETATGIEVARYSYDSFGQQTASGSLTQRYGFTGREVDAESGLMYYRARHYDAALGQFIQRDPIGFAAGDLNLYAYTWNDPYNWTDPSGLSARGNATLTAGVIGLGVAVAKSGKGLMQLASRIQRVLEGLDWKTLINTATNASDESDSDGDDAEDKDDAEPDPDCGPSDTECNHSTSDKIKKQMKKRGWSSDDITDLIDNPDSTQSTQDTRWNPDGTRMDESATAYIDENGAYVVRNDSSGDIVQVSDRYDPTWVSPF
jgi:RHS repeat-associated protein